MRWVNVVKNVTDIYNTYEHGTKISNKMIFSTFIGGVHYAVATSQFPWLRCIVYVRLRMQMNFVCETEMKRDETGN